MLPDMSEVLAEWAVPITVKTITRQTIDFEENDDVSLRTINAVVQVAQKDKLSADQIDWSLRYLTLHTVSQLQNGEFIEYGGEDYKIIDNGNWQAYGYTEALAEQSKRPLILETFTLSYSAGNGGIIAGTATQIVSSGESGTAVTATPDVLHAFVSWSDGVLTATRTDADVLADITVSATFELL